MRWYRDIKEVLKQEPETWLAYLYGQKLDQIPVLTRNKPRFQGWFFRFLMYKLFVIRNFSLFSNVNVSRGVDCLIFAGSINQMSALEGTGRALRRSGKRVVSIGHYRHIENWKSELEYIPYRFTLGDVAKSLLLMFVFGPRLIKKLKSKNVAATRYYLDNFLSIYLFLVYFHRLISKFDLEYVFVSNDHNVPNRSLLAVAHYVGVKTVYLQHASVTTFYPALRVDYAFLDGQSALDVYRQCEVNQPSTQRNVPLPRIFLSGQKKSIHRAEVQGNIVGLALNPQDDVSLAIELIWKLVESGCRVVVRWHPGQSDQKVVPLKETFADNEFVGLSDPKIEPVLVFLRRIKWLIAGNSSIHLEAALAGVRPIYYELKAPDVSDYYGYVKTGVALNLENLDELIYTVSDARAAFVPREDAVRYYSATFHTGWEGREGELVCKTLMEQKCLLGSEYRITTREY